MADVTTEEVKDEVVKEEILLDETAENSIVDKLFVKVEAKLEEKVAATEKVAKKELGPKTTEKKSVAREDSYDGDRFAKLTKDLKASGAEHTINFSPETVKNLRSIWIQKDIHSTTNDKVSDTIPAEDFVAEIGRYEKRYGLALQDVNTRRTSNSTVTLLKSTTDLTFSKVGEAVDYDNKELSIQKVTVDIDKYAGYALFTEEQLEDSSTDLLGETADQAGRGLAKAKENLIFNDSTVGLLEVAGTNEVIVNQGDGATFSTIQYEDLVDMMTGIHDAEGAKWYMNRTIWGVLLKMVDDNGRPLVGYPGVQGFVQPTLLGYPVVLVEVMPTVSSTALDKAFMVFGNLRHYDLAIRNEMMIKVLTEGRLTIGGTDYDLGHQGLVASRVAQRFGGNVRFADAFSVLKTAASS